MNPASSESTYSSGTASAQGGDPAAEDVALLGRIAAGDETALAALYDRWVQPVYGVVVQLLRGADDAEDVLEDTFWQVWQRASSFDPARGTPRAWLLTIARSRALDRVRSRGRAPEAVPLSELVPSDAPDPAASVEVEERRAQVARALAALPKEQREAIELAYFGGYTQSEIAEQLHQPIGTIKTRIRLGLRKLRALLIAAREER
jgi:RNA polymerase sigma-70 factor (ECF subfamily)